VKIIRTHSHHGHFSAQRRIGYDHHGTVGHRIVNVPLAVREFPRHRKKQRSWLTAAGIDVNARDVYRGYGCINREGK
jgi:hypothetical protein